MPRQDKPKVPAYMDATIRSFRLHLRGDVSKRTVDIYSEAPAWLAGWCADGLPDDAPPVNGWHEVRTVHLRLFFAHLAEIGYAKSYRNQLGRSMHKFFTWWAEEEEAPNPWQGFKAPRAPKLGSAPPEVLGGDQLGDILRDAEAGRDFLSRRDAALLRVFGSSGARLAEVAQLRVDGTNLETREATVTGKGGKVRVIRFDAKAARALDRYVRARERHPAAHRPELWLGQRTDRPLAPHGIRTAIARRGARLGIHVHPHLFRHTFAHRWLDNGGSEGDLCELMGWDSPDMLRLYGRSARSARARRHYDEIDPMGGI